MYVSTHCMSEKTHLTTSCPNSNKHPTIPVVLIRHILNSLSALFPMKDIVIITRYLFRKYDVFVTRYHLKKTLLDEMVVKQYKFKVKNKQANFRSKSSYFHFRGLQGVMISMPTIPVYAIRV